MTRLIILLLQIFIITSCNIKQHKAEELAIKPTTPIDDKMKIHQLIDSAITNGNDKAYNEVASYFLIENMGKDFFYYAFTMANKYNNAEACFHVYNIIAHSTPKEPKEALSLLDRKTKSLALYYLLKSYEMGFESAKYQVYEIYGKDNAPPQSSYYLQEFAEE